MIASTSSGSAGGWVAGSAANDVLDFASGTPANVGDTSVTPTLPGRAPPPGPIGPLVLFPREEGQEGAQGLPGGHQAIARVGLLAAPAFLRLLSYEMA